VQCVCEFEIGQLVKYRSWYDGDGAWISIENQVGIVLEIIEIKDIAFEHKNKEMVIYDVKVYWVYDGTVEVVPDLLLDNFDVETMDFV